LCNNSFTKGGFFLNEFERIFISSLGFNKGYRKVISFLSKRKFATRKEIALHLKIGSGGTLTEMLKNLEVCGFITKYTPFNLGSDSLLSRYNISDQYLQFYFKFIAPLHARISNGDFEDDSTTPIKSDIYRKWLGFDFERFCRKHHYMIARLLNFGAVRYNAGPFFNRKADSEKEGFQIDLVFDRADRVYTICEIKYLQSKVTSKVISDFDRKLTLFPNDKKHTIHKVLITAQGADDQLIGTGYFDNILTLEDIFNC